MAARNMTTKVYTSSLRDVCWKSNTKDVLSLAWRAVYISRALVSLSYAYTLCIPAIRFLFTILGLLSLTVADAGVAVKM